MLKAEKIIDFLFSICKLSPESLLKIYDKLEITGNQRVSFSGFEGAQAVCRRA
jgi:hypothetical protein